LAVFCSSCEIDSLTKDALMDIGQDNAANIFSAACGIAGIYLLAGGEVKIGGDGSDSDRQIEGKIAKLIAIILGN
jgi:hypothetical protein